VHRTTSEHTHFLNATSGFQSAKKKTIHRQITKITRNSEFFHPNITTQHPGRNYRIPSAAPQFNTPLHFHPENHNTLSVTQSPHEP